MALTTYEAAALKAGVWDGDAFRGVHVEDWRTAFYAKHTGDSIEAKRQAFHRVRRDMANGGMFEVNDDVYLVKDGTIQDTILRSPRPARASTVTAVTDRDISRHVTAQKPEMP